MITKINVARLKATNPYLYQRLSKWIRVDELICCAPINLLDELKRWLARDQKEQEAAAQGLREVQEKRQKEMTEDIAQAQRTKALNDELAAEARDTKAGLARLDQYVRESNLEPSEANASLVADYIQKHFQGYWSEQHVDQAIQQLQRRLTWRLF